MKDKCYCWNCELLEERSRSTAAFTSPKVEISALILASLFTNPIAVSCSSWFWYRTSGGSEDACWNADGGIPDPPPSWAINWASWPRAAALGTPGCGGVEDVVVDPVVVGVTPVVGPPVGDCGSSPAPGLGRNQEDTERSVDAVLILTVQWRDLEQLAEADWVHAGFGKWPRVLVDLWILIAFQEKTSEQPFVAACSSSVLEELGSLPATGWNRAWIASAEDSKTSSASWTACMEPTSCSGSFLGCLTLEKEATGIQESQTLLHLIHPDLRSHSRYHCWPWKHCHLEQVAGQPMGWEEDHEPPFPDSFVPTGCHWLRLRKD